MARNRIVWTRRRPRRAVGRLTGTLLVGAVVVAAAWLAFGDEPARAADGAVNPFALVVPAAVGIVVLLCLPSLVAALRRPSLAADNYALTVRPGSMRTLVLPWALIAELALVVVDGEPYLLVRCGPRLPGPGDWPRWWDRNRLRALRRVDPLANAYDLAVRVHDFVGRPSRLFAAVAQCTPEHVTLSTRVSR